ncbi:hypothetical protein FJZ31_33970 [Candidatus Poribacteria bacterium]|nr:hypothetical protein [Candidatus Poribacteria bacterium]
MWKDPIVEEIHKIRLNIETECDNDFDRIFAQAIEAQGKLVNRLVPKPASNSQMGAQKLGEKSKSKPSDEVPVSVDNVQESTIHLIERYAKKQN